MCRSHSVSNQGGVCQSSEITISSNEATAPSIFERITDIYLTAVQDFSQFLFRNGWKTCALAIPSLFGELGESILSAVRRIFGWETTLTKCYGFYNAADPASLDCLLSTLKDDPGEKERIPVLLFHGLFSTPDIWMPWAMELEKAEKSKKIGPLITLQLPNDLQERMKVVYKAIDDVAEIYRQAGREQPFQVDLVGHSLGGYAGHLAAFLPDQITLKDEKGVRRRWHNVGPSSRNETVRKVVSVAGPTWLCCTGQHDETTVLPPEREDIYPKNVFTTKKIEGSFTPDQIATIRSTHQGIYDIVGSYDAISSTVSPLPEEQVYQFKLGHVGLATDPRVCQIAISILAA